MLSRLSSMGRRQAVGLALLAALGGPGAWAAGDHGRHDHAPAHGDTHAAHGPAAIGAPGDPARVTRTIEVRLDDKMRFVPDTLRVKVGETVRFVVRNQGAVPHEMVLGTLDELTDHAEQMRATPGMAHHEPNAVSLHAGERGALVWHFTQAGTVDFACTLPGHLEAGMVGRIVVTR